MKLRIHRFNGGTEVVQTGSDVAQNPVNVAQDVAQRLAQCGSECGSERGSDHYKPVVAMRNAGILPPYRIILNMFPLVAGVVAAGLTVRQYPVKIQLVAYLISVASMILLDTFRAITMFLAPQTRVLLSGDLLLVMPVIFYQNKRYIAVVSVWIVLSVVIIKLLNRRWLYFYNWLMSDSVRRALTKNPEGKGFLAWQNHGKREARTLMSECGQKFDNNTLDSQCMYMYLLGFYDAYQKNSKAKKAVQKAQETIEDMIAYTDELSEENADLANDLEELTADFETESKNNDEQMEVYRISCKNLQEENKRLLEEVEQLRKANEELSESVPDVTVVADVVESMTEDRDSRILRDVAINAELRTKGLPYKGYRVIAEEYGVSKGYIDRLVKRKKDSEKVVHFPSEERKEACL